MDPVAILRSRGFVALLVFAAVLGVIVSFVSWGFLELVHAAQEWIFLDLPDVLGFDTAPTWWAIPVCAIAALPVAFAISRLPGAGGHVPAEGLKAGGSAGPNVVPGVALAAFATLAGGLVLGPEAPLIAVGSGVAVFVVQRVKRDATPTMLTVLGAAGSFAAISVVFGSPIMAAIVIIEASGIGGAMLPFMLIPGLVAAGVGSLVFIGMTHWSGLDTTAYSMVPLTLEAFGAPTPGEIAWTIALGIAAAALTFPIRQLGLRIAAFVPTRTFPIVVAAGLAVGALAYLFAQFTDEPANLVLFSGQDELNPMVDAMASLTVGTLLLLLLFKGLAWAISLGTFRGGPTFPAMFLGAVGGIAASHLPGLPSAVAIPVGMGVMTVAILRLPLSAIVIASLLCASAGPGAAPLVILGVVVTYLATLALESRLAPAAELSSELTPEAPTSG